MEKLNTPENKEKLQEVWKELDDHVLDYAFNIMQSQAYIDHTDEINSVYALVPIVTYIYQKRSSKLTEDEIRDFLWETWRFIKQIFPLLIIGVFAVGVIRGLIKPEWVQTLAGSNTILGNFIGVVFGVFMYFPTLVEVPIAQMFLSLGMHRGPLLAYLISDPELSLQSILITASIIGKLKAWVYVGWVALFSTLSGLLYGAWVNGINIWIVAGYLVVFLLILFIIFMLIERGKKKSEIAG